MIAFNEVKDIFFINGKLIKLVPLFLGLNG